MILNVNYWSSNVMYTRKETNAKQDQLYAMTNMQSYCW
jgi:hypothetical protein